MKFTQLKVAGVVAGIAVFALFNTSGPTAAAPAECRQDESITTVTFNLPRCSAVESNTNGPPLVSFMGVFAMTGEVMLSVSLVAQRLGVSDQTIRNWCRDGLMPAVRPPGSRKWLIPEASFEEWLARSGNALVRFHGMERDERTDEELLAELASAEAGRKPQARRRAVVKTPPHNGSSRPTGGSTPERKTRSSERKLH